MEAKQVAQIQHDQQWHRMDRAARQMMPVSRYSRWGDSTWRFPNPVAGSRDPAIIWGNRRLFDGSSLTDPQWCDLLEALKLFSWSLLSEPYRNKKPSPGSIAILAQGIPSFAEFLAEERVLTLADVNEATVWRYCDWLLSKTVEDDPDSHATVGALEHRLTIIQQLERQAPILRDAGHPAPRGRLLDRPLHTLAKDLSGQARGWIPPLPDEVALALVNAAERLLWEAAEDVIALQDKYLELRQQAEKLYSPQSREPKQVHIREGLIGFAFTTLPQNEKPWHPPIESGGRQNPITHQIRTAIRIIRDACVIIIQSCVGIRISEVCGLQTTKDHRIDDFPSCIDIREGASGVNELFYLKGLVFKLTEEPEPAEWVIGSRPKQSRITPVTVRAIAVLDRLFRPWREMGLSKELIVSFPSSKVLPYTASQILPISSSALNEGLKRFASEFVDWDAIPETGCQRVSLTDYKEARGNNIRSHQWRKNFAIFIFRVDSRMVPAISRHFKHLGIAMTEQAYIGNDVIWLEDIRSEHSRQTAIWMYEISHGERPVTGDAVALVQAHKDIIDANLANTRSSSIRRLKSVCEEKGIRIFFADHGNCYISLSSNIAQCHKVAGTRSWANKRPNSITQSPAVCAGCKGFAIDSSHIPFWVERYRSNQLAWASARNAGRESEFWVARSRMRQAAAILSQLDPEALGESHDD